MRMRIPKTQKHRFRIPVRMRIRMRMRIRIPNTATNTKISSLLLIGIRFDGRLPLPPWFRYLSCLRPSSVTPACVCSVGRPDGPPGREGHHEGDEVHHPWAEVPGAHLCRQNLPGFEGAPARDQVRASEESYYFTYPGLTTCIPVPILLYRTYP